MTEARGGQPLMGDAFGAFGGENRIREKFLLSPCDAAEHGDVGTVCQT